MDTISHLALGFGVAFGTDNLLYCFIGALLGTLIGVLPGLGPLATVAMLLPITFSLPPTGALIMLSGIYYGAQYGGSTTAILVNLPGEASSFVTSLDGYQMARQGRAGPALAIAAIGSFFAGCVATLAIAILAPPLSQLARQFGAPEYFALLMLGLVASVVLASGSLIKALAMVLLGLLLSSVGMDVAGYSRMTFGILDLDDGLDFVTLAMGMFGIAEILRNLSTPQEETSVLKEKIRGLMPTRRDLRDAGPAIVRGTALGTVLGVLPGGGALLASFGSYMIEKRVSKEPETFGKGNIRGVAAPESANNAGAQTSFIPLLTLGMPGNAMMAMMMGAMMLLGVQPGPLVMTQQPDLFWGIVASMWIGNLMLVIINLPLIGIWVRLLRVPYSIMFPAVLLLCGIGVYSIGNSALAVLEMALFGILGFMLFKLRYEVAPLILGFVLGDLIETNLRRALLISNGDFGILVKSPISIGLLGFAALLLVITIFPKVRSAREVAFQEES